ncbi:MAG: hypothetical protein ACFE8G_13625 [Candidatus Hermodarchaeota archaeon]
MLLSIILFGILSTSIGASETYQLTLVKGTEEFIVERYNDADWKITVDPSLTPSDWFEGEANVTNAKSKITLKGWTPNTWDTYDVLTSIFMPEYFSFGEILELLIIMDLQGYNETAINTNYNYNYSLWYGLRAVWNYTDNDFEEKPSYNDGVIILQNPLEFKTMLNDYNTLAAELNGNIAIILSGYSFPIISADDFLWQLALNGLAIAEPQNNYLESMVNELGCENVSVIGSSIVIQRYGLTNYTVEISYGEEGMMSSFTVKNIDDSIIYQIKSSNSDLIFYLILIIVAVSAGTIVTFLTIRKKKLHR